MAFDDRTKVLVGEAGAARLAAARVCVLGLGGVGAAAAMDLVRAGVGALVAIDFDTVQESNLNRLYFGYSDALGLPKTEAFARAARAVNPEVRLELRGSIVRGREAAERLPEGCDFYLDCIDSLNPKVNAIAAMIRAGLPFASSMGTAGRLAPERLRVGSLWDSSGCPLAQRVRQRLRRFGFRAPATREEKRAAWLARDLARKAGEEPPPGDGLIEAEIRCVWSDEPAAPPAPPPGGLTPGQVIDGVRIRAVQGSAPFVPQAAGHIMASLAVRAILGRA